MRLKNTLRRGVAAAVIAGIVVTSGLPVYAKTWDISEGSITVEADGEGKPVSQEYLHSDTHRLLSERCYRCVFVFL